MMEEGHFRAFLEENYTHGSDSDSKYFVAAIIHSFLMFLRCGLSSEKDVGLFSLVTTWSVI